MSIAVQTTFNRMAENRGHLYDRVQFGGLEAAFAKHWEEENEPESSVNHGCGLLQNLFFAGSWPFQKCVHMVTRSERYVAATVIQWLGTNCGFAFLQEVLRSEGMYIARIPEQKPLRPDPPARKLHSRRFA